MMIYDKTYEVIVKRFELLLNRYEIGLKTSMKVSDFIFNSIHLLIYKCHKINLNQGGSYIDSPDWIKNKKPIINPIRKKDNKYLQCTVAVALITMGRNKLLMRKR